MQFNFTVQVINTLSDGFTKAFLFKPTILSINTGEAVTLPDDTQGLTITTTLRQNLNDTFGSYIEQIRTHVLPKNALQNIVSGIDLATGLPSVDPVKLNALLANFGLQTII